MADEPIIEEKPKEEQQEETIGLLTPKESSPRLNTFISEKIRTSNLEDDLNILSKKVINRGNSGTAITIDWRQGEYQKLILTANCTIAWKNAITGKNLTLILTQDITGSRTITWPSAVYWGGNTAPTLTTAVGKTDIIRFISDGIKQYGYVIGQNFYQPTTYSYEQKFNTLNTTDLNGQDNWSGNAIFDVQTTTRFEGAKAIVAINPTGYLTIARTIIPSNTGTIYVAVQLSENNVGQLHVELYEGSTARMDVKLDQNGDILMYDGATPTWVDIGNYIANQWYVIAINFNYTTSATQYNVKYHNGTSWSSLYTYGIMGGSFGEINKIILSTETAGTYNCYWDTITPTDPI